MATLREVKKRIRSVALTLLVLAIVVVSCSTTLQAQSKFSFGPRAGLSLSSPYHSGWSNTYFNVGFAGGMFISMEVSNRFSFQSEILFIEKSPTIAFFSSLKRLKTSYLEMPLLAKWNIMPVGGSPIRLLAGGTVSYNLSATLPRISGFESADSNLDFKNSIKDFDFGLMFGVSFEIPTGTGRLVLDARYAFGLTSIVESTLLGVVKHKNLSSMIGYVIPIGK